MISVFDSKYSGCRCSLDEGRHRVQVAWERASKFKMSVDAHAGSMELSRLADICFQLFLNVDDRYGGTFSGWQ